MKYSAVSRWASLSKRFMAGPLAVLRPIHRSLVKPAVVCTAGLASNRAQVIPSRVGAVQGVSQAKAYAVAAQRAALTATAFKVGVKRAALAHRASREVDQCQPSR